MTPTPDRPAPEVLPGAEAWSAPGGPHGALVLHGFTGNPNSMRGVAKALAAAGFAVELPRLPGHGTTVADMMTTTWADWSATAEAAYCDLAGRCERVVVVGLSMGGALTAWLASFHPEIAGIVTVNPVVQAPEGMRALVQDMVDAGQTAMDGIGSDIADPDVTESAYRQTPLAPLLSLFEAAEEFGARLGDIACPVLIITSRQDHVVEPVNSDVLAAGVSGPVERVTLDRSYHVATLDHDRDEVERRTVEFATRVSAGSA
ncbi:alpha/beta fold hydrolase [soil metagenome]